MSHGSGLGVGDRKQAHYIPAWVSVTMDTGPLGSSSGLIRKGCSRGDKKPWPSPELQTSHCTSETSFSGHVNSSNLMLSSIFFRSGTGVTRVLHFVASPM